MTNIDEFLSKYEVAVINIANSIHNIIISTLPEIKVTLDIQAKMIAFSYGNKYSQMICAIFPSKKAVKLSFNRGTTLQNFYPSLSGNAKITRYLEFKDLKDIDKSEIIQFLLKANELYLTNN